MQERTWFLPWRCGQCWGRRLVCSRGAECTRCVCENRAGSVLSGVNIVLTFGILPVLPNPLRGLANVVSSPFVFFSADSQTNTTSYLIFFRSAFFSSLFFRCVLLRVCLVSTAAAPRHCGCGVSMHSPHVHSNPAHPYA